MIGHDASLVPVFRCGRAAARHRAPLDPGRLRAGGVGVSFAPKAEVLWQAGAIGVFDHEAADAFVSIEARLRREWHRLRPWSALTLSSSGSWFAGAGLIYDLRLTRRSRITFGSGPFYHTHNDEDDDLGFSLEFYSFIEASWEWQAGKRIGVRSGHLSNAGLGRRNPGTEIAGFFISVPLGGRPAAGVASQ